MENVEYYKTLAIICLVTAIIMAALAILLWVKLNIRRDLAVLTGSEARRDIEKIKKDAASGAVQNTLRSKNNGAVISWNTSGDLDSNSEDADKTVLLDEAKEGAYEDPNATILLDTGFVIEREEGTNNKA
jgi:hypothetical protein